MIEIKTTELCYDPILWRVLAKLLLIMTLQDVVNMEKSDMVFVIRPIVCGKSKCDRFIAEEWSNLSTTKQ
jgi:hypothetical protein